MRLPKAFNILLTALALSLCLVPATWAQAASLAYVDTFKVLAVGAAIMFLLSFALKKNDPGGGGVRVAE